MALDLEEQEQVAELKAWWQQHGRLVTAVIVAAALGFAGWQGWRIYQQNQAANAAGLYDTLARAAEGGDAKAMRDAGGTLIESYPRTLYASMGALVAARFHFDRSDLKSAKAQLQWVLDNTPSDELRDLARLRLAAVLLDEKAYDEALKLLERDARAAFEAQYAAMQGDMLVAKNQPAEARAAYKLALEKTGDAGRRLPRERAHAPGRTRGLRCGRLRSRRRVLLALALARAAAAAARRGPQPAELTALENPRPLRVRWSTSLQSRTAATLAGWRAGRRRRGPLDLLPVLVGDAIYATSRDGVVARLDAASGRRALAHRGRDAACRAASAPTRDTVAVANEDGEVVALDAAERQGALARARVERGARAARSRRRPGAGAQHRQPDLCVRRERRQAPLGLPARRRPR